MDTEYVRAKTAVAIAYADSRHQPEPSGAVIPVGELAENLQESLRDDDPWLLNLFEPANQDAYNLYVGFVATLEEQDESVTPDESEEPEVEVVEETPAAAMKAQQRRKRKVAEEETVDPKAKAKEPATS